MAIESRIAQKDKLHALLVIKKDYKDAGLAILPSLEFLILQAKAVMEAEDAAYVEKQVEGAA